MTEPKKDALRLFVACEVPEDVKSAVGTVTATLREESGSAVRWVNPENVHLTLKFLGEVPQKTLPAVKIAMQEAVVRHSPFSLEFSNIGMFGGREGLRTMWMGIAGDILRLEALARDMNRALDVVGFEADRRPFRPHLTIGRVRDHISTRERAAIEVAVGKTNIPPAQWRTSQVSLIRSKLTKSGARYETVATFPLRSAPIH
jgi:RNA 2',3'-cyclic 3'-phosphodiesterase